MKWTIEDIKTLRDKTGAGVMDCKEALLSTDGDIEKAIIYLREKGHASIEKRKAKELKEGVIFSYVHPGNKVGGLVEVNCETDFVARNEEFLKLVKDIVIQIVTMKPEYISKEDVLKDELEKIKETFRAEARVAGKPEGVIEKIVEGKTKKYLEKICLLEQTFVWDEEKKVKDLILDFSAKTGEKIRIRRFARFEVGK